MIVLEIIREEYDHNMGYACKVDGEINHDYSSKPISIEWELSEPISHHRWKAAAKMLIG